MKKNIILWITTAALLLSACGASDKNTTTDSTEQSVVSAENSGTHDFDPAEMPTEDVVPEPVTPTEEKFDAKTPYGNTSHYIEVLGLKEYDSLGKGNTLDKPADGKVFLVLFLNVENRTETDDYINPYYVTATVDGTEIENTVLVNDPKGYTTLFTHIQPEESMSGFVVWEVPEKWKTLDVNFDNWKDTDHVLLDASFTRDDLKDPAKAEK